MIGVTIGQRYNDSMSRSNPGDLILPAGATSGELTYASPVHGEQQLAYHQGKLDELNSRDYWTQLMGVDERYWHVAAMLLRNDNGERLLRWASSDSEHYIIKPEDLYDDTVNAEPIGLLSSVVRKPIELGRWDTIEGDEVDDATGKTMSNSAHPLVAFLAHNLVAAPDVPHHLHVVRNRPGKDPAVEISYDGPLQDYMRGLN